MNEQELQALLARVAALETKNAELESKFGEIETQVDTVNKFISAITESQSLENTMNEIESVTMQLTNCDKATFYCYDNTNDKFFFAWRLPQLAGRTECGRTEKRF